MNGAKMVLASHFSAEAFYQKRYWKFIGELAGVIEVFLCMFMQKGMETLATLHHCTTWYVFARDAIHSLFELLTRWDKWLRRLSANTLGVPKNSPPKPISIHHQSADLESQPDYTCDMNLDFGSTCGYRFAILSSRSQRKPIWIMRCDE